MRRRLRGDLPPLGRHQRAQLRREQDADLPEPSCLRHVENSQASLHCAASIMNCSVRIRGAWPWDVRPCGRRPVRLREGHWQHWPLERVGGSSCTPRDASARLCLAPHWRGPLVVSEPGRTAPRHMTLDVKTFHQHRLPVSMELERDWFPVSRRRSLERVALSRRQHAAPRRAWPILSYPTLRLQLPHWPPGITPAHP